MEKSIKKIHQEFEQLKSREWFILKENIRKAKKQKRDILSELADKVLSDIAKKENQLDEIKRNIGKDKSLQKNRSTKISRKNN